jgi:hypothetical protein
MHVITVISEHSFSPPFRPFAPLRYTPPRTFSEILPLPRLITRSSDIHAAGCFTLEDIPRGTVVLEYTGERITKDEGDRRYEGRSFTYLFGVGNGDVVIDGHSMAMFINHSCKPNCEIDEIAGRIFVKTLRNLKAGEELTYDYWLYDGDDEAPCSCGAKNCRGSMYSPEEMKRMKRVAAKAARQAELAQRKAARQTQLAQRTPSTRTAVRPNAG